MAPCTVDNRLCIGSAFLEAGIGKASGGLPRGSVGWWLRAEVPLAEMFGYATDMRSATQGRATFSMEFSRYAEVPASIADGIINRTG